MLGRRSTDDAGRARGGQVGTLEAIKVKILIMSEEQNPLTLRIELTSENDFFHFNHNLDEHGFRQVTPKADTARMRARTHLCTHAHAPPHPHTPNHTHTPHNGPGMDGDGHARERGHEMVDFPEYPNVLIRSRLLERARPWLYSPARSACRSPPAPPRAHSEARAHSADLMRLLLARSLARAHTRMGTRTVLNNCIKEPHSHLAVFVIEREGLARLDFIQNMEYKFVELLS